MEEQLEAAEEEEEEELEAAEEQGLLVGAEKRGVYYRIKHSSVGRAALCALRVDGDCDYFLHERMSSKVSVPESYFRMPTPPFYYGAGAVPAGSPILVATSEHYSVRGKDNTRASCKGVACANLSVYRPPIDCDRFELVPAAALLTPKQRSRWPLQLRVQAAVVYTESPPSPSTTATPAVAHSAAASRSNLHAPSPPAAVAATSSSPSLISLQRLGFEPDFAAFSSRNPDPAVDALGVVEYKGVGRSTPAAVLAVLVIVTCAPLVLLCGRCLRALIGDESASLQQSTDDWDCSPDGSPLGDAPPASSAAAVAERELL
jgi:hypothetical protein